MTRIDRRSDEAAEYRKLYKTARWRRLRVQVIQRDMGTCQRCKVPVVYHSTSPRSAVVHHVKAHKGDEVLFFDESNTELVCKQCHDGAIQFEEARGFSNEIGLDGWPTDPNHPSNR